MCESGLSDLLNAVKLRIDDKRIKLAEQEAISLSSYNKRQCKNILKFYVGRVYSNLYILSTIFHNLKHTVCKSILIAIKNRGLLYDLGFYNTSP